ncbi:MAG: class I SAM-dependent methyltransferase, partial [Anaerolineae bacterium]|nr:class I SAM-dependent methyltransferase [Anaerolineae bacterium]
MQPLDFRLQQQIDYYRARASEYDEWFYRIGRYDYGETVNRQWFAEAQQVMDTLQALGPFDNVLELAAGTGIWTEQLVKASKQVTALDASPEVLVVNEQKLMSDKVTYQQADLFQWQPEATYDLVFFSFWLSHVPPQRLDDFLDKVSRATRPGGRVFLVDSRRAQTSTAHDHTPYGEQSVEHVRKLN